MATDPPDAEATRVSLAEPTRLVQEAQLTQVQQHRAIAATGKAQSDPVGRLSFVDVKGDKTFLLGHLASRSDLTLSVIYLLDSARAQLLDSGSTPEEWHQQAQRLDLTVEEGDASITAEASSADEQDTTSLTR